VLCAIEALVLSSCSSDEGPGAAPPGPQPLPVEAKAPPRRRRSNPLTFSGMTLDGRPVDVAQASAERRVVVYLFDPSSSAAEATARVAERLHRERHAYNLEVVGVAVPPGYKVLSARRIPTKRPSADELAALARACLKKQEATFPCVVDPDAKTVEAYTTAWGISRMDELPAFYCFAPDATGALRPVFPRYAAQSPEPVDYLFRRVLRRFGIEATADVDPLVGDLPPAPAFAVTDSAGKAHSLADYRGRVLLLVFVATDCPRCKDLLGLLGRLYEQLGPGARKQAPWLDVLAICTDASGDALKRFVADHGCRFPVAPDPQWAVRGAFRYRGAVPDTFVIGPDGRIHSRHRGFDATEPALLRMETLVLLGIRTRPLLTAGVYSGDQACRICHRSEHTDWALTRHACAWETLVRLGREDDPDCAICHVVGFRQSGGFLSEKSTPHLTSVQCESCHGQNGCTAFQRPGTAGAPMPAAKPVEAAACLRCHDAIHSPRFDFAAYRPRILHNRGAELAKLPRAEREARLKRLCSGARDQLFDPDTPHVGSAACGKCHPTEYKALKDGAHAKALEPLAKAAPSGWSVPRHKRGVVGISRPECVRCHVTGFGGPGGFPSAIPAKPLEHPLAGVGCEACHGPGKAHAADPKKPKAILHLGGTCPECNILTICRQCHDDENSPHFDYRQALPKARHPVGPAVAP